MTKKAKRTRRRGNGQGSVWRQGNKWRWQYIMGVRQDGSRIVIGGQATTSVGAHEALASAITDHKRQVLAEPDKVTVGDFSERWLSRQYDIEPRTVKKYRDELAYILCLVGNLKVQDVTHEILSDAIAQVAQRKMSHGKPIAKQTLARVVTRLKAVFREAVLAKIIYANPMADVKKPKLQVNERARMRFLTAEQADRLLTVGQTLHDVGLCHVWPLINLLLQTGLRCSEALGLRWQDVNFDAETISVRQTVVRNERGGSHTKQGGKTDPSRRTLPVPPQVLEILRRRQEMQAVERRRAKELWPSGSDFVFTTETGRPYDGSGVNRALRSIVKWSDPVKQEGRHWIRVNAEQRLTLLAAVKGGLRLPHTSAHDLRHTYATLSLQRGVEVTIVSKALGHKNVATTLSIYRHVLDDEVRKSLAATFRPPLSAPPLPQRVLN